MNTSPKKDIGTPTCTADIRAVAATANRHPSSILSIVFLLCAVLLATSPAAAAEVTVSAAASLSDAFREIVKDYERTTPKQKIWLNTGASGALLQQMENGAPVDVFASADQDTMTSAIKASLVSPAAPKLFARNKLVVIVPIDAKTSSSKPADLLAGKIKRIALGNPKTVPAGHYGQAALQSAGVWNDLQGTFVLAENVRQALAYVARGEVDAGIVYATDAKLFPDKVKVAFELPSPLAIQYLIAPTASAKDPAAAAKFVRYVTSPAAATIFNKYGFGPAK